MDKDKLMQMIDDYSYMENLSGSKYGYMADLPRDVFEDLVDRQENIRREIYSKSVMPKVFDEWFKLLNKPTQGEALSILYWVVFDIDVRTREQQNLFDWIKGDGSEFIFMRRISKCIDAVKYGYEVEK